MDISVGFCVRTKFATYKGGPCYVASLKRDSSTVWKIAVFTSDSINGDRLALDAWMKKFTGKGSVGFNSDCEVVARGSDADGSYWILQPKRFH